VKPFPRLCVDPPGTRLQVAGWDPVTTYSTWEIYNFKGADTV
jgi:hypothetical protein